MFYKIHISSDNVISGTSFDGIYNVQVNISEMSTDYTWQIACESFYISTFPSPYMVQIANMPFGDCTYSTTSKTNNSIILMNAGSIYQRSILNDAIGLPISSIVSLRNTNVRVQLVDPITGDVYGGTAPTWSMILVLYAKKR
jgi:hypothetical protein